MSRRKIVLKKLPDRTGDPRVDIRRMLIAATHLMRLIDGEWYYQVDEEEETKDKPP